MTVGISRVDGDVRSAVREAMELASWREHVPAGCHVALKPNLCWDLPMPGAQTSPWVFEAVCEILAEHVAEIVVVEANQVTVDGDLALERTGIGRVVRKHGLEFVNMSHGDFYRAELANGSVLHRVELPEVLRDRVLVTLPVLKTHGTTTITGALKNQWGCLKMLRHNYHLVVDDAIADLNDLLRPAFAVMDGTVAMQGNGPKTGTPVVADLVLASGDMVALDTVAATVMGFDPAEIGHIQAAARRGLGEADIERIEVAGVAVDDASFHFDPPVQNIVARTEFALRKSPLKRFFFDTPVLSGLAFAAKWFNWLWYERVGKKERARILAETRYGPQWLGHSEGEDA
jgi:uncharacterized protein (DUF362 family)